MSEIEVTGLYVYPIKSCSGSVVNSIELEPTGFKYDRQWMVVDSSGKFMSQRKNPELALVHPEFAKIWHGADILHVSAPGMEPIDISAQVQPDDSKIVEASIHGKPVQGQEVSKSTSEWFSTFMATEVRLIQTRSDLPRHVTERYHQNTAANQVGFADGFPLTLASESSLRKLNEEFDEPVPMSRFRPNIIIDGENLRPYSEDHWRNIRIGNVSAFVVRACSRCEIPDTNQLTAQRGTEVRRALSHTRRGIDVTNPVAKKEMFFMQNMLHEFVEGQTVQIGDPVELVTGAAKPNITFS